MVVFSYADRQRCFAVASGDDEFGGTVFALADELLAGVAETGEFFEKAAFGLTRATGRL